MISCDCFLLENKETVTVMLIKSEDPESQIVIAYV